MSRILKSCAFCCVLLTHPVVAAPLDGEKTVFLVDGQGTRVEIAEIRFEGGSYKLDWKDDSFADHFLSMRPFKCLEGPDKHWCHVPYPYDNLRQARPEDLTDLEYDLLFIWKGATEYGINMWNGVYYRLSIEGDGLTGQLYEVDMDVLSAPPQAGNLRPLLPADLHDADPDSHWLPGLLIE